MSVLDPAKTRALLVAAACDGQTVSYGAIPKASDAGWSEARPALDGHIWALDADCILRGEPMLGVLVVRRDGQISEDLRASLAGHAAQAGRFSGEGAGAEDQFILQERERAFAFWRQDRQEAGHDLHH